MKHLKLIFALFAMLALGVGNAWGEEVTETITMKNFGGLTTGSLIYQTKPGLSDKGTGMVAFAFTPTTGQVRGNQTGIVGASVTTDQKSHNWSLYNSDPMAGVIKAIKVTQTATGTNKFQNNLYVSLGTSSQGEVTAVTNAQKQDAGGTAQEINFTIDPSKGYTYFKLLSNEKFTSGTVAGVIVTVTYETAGGGVTPDPGTGEGGEEPENPTPGTGGETVTYVFKDDSNCPGNDKTWFSGTIDEYTGWTATKGTNDPKYYDSGTGLRIYNGGKFTITSTKVMTSITLTFSGTGYTFSADNTTNPLTVTPNAKSYEWSVSRACRLQKIEITYAADAGGSDEPEAEIVKTLKSIAVSDMTTIYEQGDAFSFDGKCTATYSVTKDGAAQADQTAKVEPTSVSTPDMNQLGTQTVTVTYTEGEVTKTADYTITIEEAPTYDFRKIEGFDDWGSSYIEHIVEYADANVTFASADKNSSTITDQPVTKGGDVSLVLKDGMNIATVKWVCTQWTTKAQEITLHYSKDGGVTYTSTGITSENFTISSDNLPAGTNAVKITFSSANQVGIKSCTITKVEAAAITQVPAPQFSLQGGAYDGAQSVELTCTMADATIYYTTDGNDPTTSSSVYSTAIQVTESMTIKAYAVKEGLEDSPVVEATYEISAPADVVLDFTTNTWSLPEGNANKATEKTDFTNGDYTVSIAAPTAYYFDSNNLFLGKKDAYIVLPVFNKPIVKIVCEGVSSGSGSVTFNVFVDDKAVSTEVTSCKVDQTFLIAEDEQIANVAHVIKVTNANNLRIAKIKIYLGEAPAVERPIIAGEEEFAGSTEVSITCATSGAKIYYTTDETTPTDASPEYTTPFELTETKTVKAIAYVDGQASAVATKTFTFIETITCVQASEIALAQSANNVQTEKKYRIIAYVTETLSAVSSNQQSFKVVDNIGDESVFQSFYCNVPEEMVVGMKVEMIGKLSKYNDAAQMKNGDVTILEKPIAEPQILGADAFETSTEVTITAEEGLKIFYTLNGDDPTTSSIEYSAPFELSATTTVKAIAYNSATAKSSTVAEKTFTKTAIPAMTIAEFIANQGGACYLEGTVSNIVNTTYGNFDLTDATGTIYIYGCLNANGEAKKFAELGVKEGDLLKVQANVYELYKEKHEAIDVVYVSHVSNSEEPEMPELPSIAENATFVFNTAEGLADLGIAYPTTEDGTGKKTDIENNTTVISNGVGLTMTGGNTTATRIWLTASGALDLRVYKGATLTFAVADGYEITKVVFDGSTLAKLSVGGVAVDGATKTWEGSQKSVTFDATDGVKINTIAVTVAYTRSVTSGKYGTICLPYGSTKYSGATFFEIAYKETGKVYIDEVTALEAGVPYIFQAKSSKLSVTYEGTPVGAKSNNGLYGTFIEIADVAAHTSNKGYILINNVIRFCEADCNVPANRAYIVLDDISTTAKPAPQGRRRVGMSVQGENETTGIGDLFTTEAPAKVIENGQLIIIRDGVKYNVQGQKL